MLSFPNRRSTSLPPNGPPELADALHAHVVMLAETIGERNLPRRPQALEQAACYIEQVWRDQGLIPSRHSFDVDGQTCANIDVTLPGRIDECIVVGAHYDSVMECPGANDNGSGVAALLELSRLMLPYQGRRTMRFVAFVNEEPPYFETPHMGSDVYARACRAQNLDIAAMVCLETIGCYKSADGSQDYPALLKLMYPRRGNFIAVVGNFKSAWLVHRIIASSLAVSPFPIEGIATFASIPGVDWSDHASFWRQKYPAVMITDTAPYRFNEYHTRSDTIDTINFGVMAELTRVLQHVLLDLAGASAPGPDEIDNPGLAFER